VTLDAAAWRGRRVLITGHTGFKGGWLALWLAKLGAEVGGFALDPPTRPSFFEAARIAELVAADQRGDIRDAARTREAVERFGPEIVFHLAAQPIVKEGYRAPVETYETNVAGTASVLEACRHARALRAIVVVTTDKVYENRESGRGYVESDALGGHDPYSSSKACAELVSQSFRRCFLAERGIGLATARAGNVIGGGDWGPDRLIPDLVRAVAADEEALIRNPDATRPWQHVLEPLLGYLLLARALVDDPQRYARAWNFGPAPGGDRPVRDVITAITTLWGGKPRWRADPAPHPHEAGKLMLDSTRARDELGWRPRLSFAESIRLTTEWYGAWLEGKRDLAAESEAQVRYYSALSAQPA
jgi:CDP-glucose 4,6-dehydratase